MSSKVLAPSTTKINITFKKIPSILSLDMPYLSSDTHFQGTATQFQEYSRELWSGLQFSFCVVTDNGSNDLTRVLSDSAFSHVSCRITMFFLKDSVILIFPRLMIEWIVWCKVLSAWLLLVLFKVNKKAEFKVCFFVSCRFHGYVITMVLWNLLCNNIVR